MYVCIYVCMYVRAYAHLCTVLQLLVLLPSHPPRPSLPVSNDGHRVGDDRQYKVFMLSARDGPHMQAEGFIVKVHGHVIDANTKACFAIPTQLRHRGVHLHGMKGWICSHVYVVLVLILLVSLPILLGLVIRRRRVALP